MAAELESDLTIGGACDRTGLSPRTVRYYEELGLLPGVRRRAGGRRVYGEDELQRLHFIQRLKTLGLSLAEIKDLNAVYAIAGSTGQMLGRLDELLGRHLIDLDKRIGELSALHEEMSRYRARVRAGAGAATSPPESDGPSAARAPAPLNPTEIPES